ncbi:MAG: hypothetical protein ACK5MP_10460 [Nostocoides sp.]
MRTRVAIAIAALAALPIITGQPATAARSAAEPGTSSCVVGGGGTVPQPLLRAQIHAVNRITSPSVTVIYYSLAFGQTPPKIRDFPVTDYGAGARESTLLQGWHSQGVFDAAAVIVGQVSHGAIAATPQATLAGGIPQPTAAGETLTSYVVTTAIPKNADRVDVMLGPCFFLDVPVGDGTLGPVVPGTPELGHGWPRVELGGWADVDGPPSVFKLTSHVAAAANPLKKATASSTAPRTP